MSKLTHFNKQGSAHMVDIGDKAITRRLAIASGSINMQKETISLIKEKNIKKVTFWELLKRLELWLQKKPVNLFRFAILFH